jgi:hypothetical protein
MRARARPANSPCRSNAVFSPPALSWIKGRRVILLTPIWRCEMEKPNEPGWFQSMSVRNVAEWVISICRFHVFLCFGLFQYIFLSTAILSKAAMHQFE